MALPSDQIGSYVILSHLGTGTTGKVKLAQHMETHQEVAIKIVNKSLFDTKKDLQRKIRREIALMRLLDHPHLIHLVEMYESARHLYLILEYAQKGELFDYLVERRKLEPNIALSFFRQIVYGLDYLHSLSICHRDLKPENILLDSNFNIKIADFGFARWMKGQVAETSCGSPHYAAPEIIRGEIYDGKAADIWSCGVILYALLIGRLPFDDPQIRNLLSKIKIGHFYMPDLKPPILTDLIYRMITVEPKDRITIPQIKEHPAFHLFLPESYRCPTPLPLPVITEQFKREDIDVSIITILKHLGYTDDEEIYDELESPYHTMAKSFYTILTSKLNILSLPWDETVDQVEEAIMMSPKIAPRESLTIQGRDQFFRRNHYPNPGSPDMFSFVSSPMGPQYHFETQQDSIVQLDPNYVSVEALSATIIEALESENFSYFFPNDISLIVRWLEIPIYALIIFEIADFHPMDFSDVKPVIIKIQMVNGEISGFNHLVDILKSATFAYSNQ